MIYFHPMKLFNSAIFQSPQTVTGIMTGTSLDGADICTAEWSGPSGNLTFNILHSSTFPIHLDLKTALLSVANQEPVTIQTLLKIESDYTLWLVEAFSDHLKKLNKNISPRPLIALHGQTIGHFPTDNTPTTCQLVNGALFAQRTNCLTLTDFRRADMAVGGQGAPLMPVLDRELLSPFAPLAVVNIGGISNISFMYDDRTIMGFDCGPGNMLMDYIAQTYFGQSFDHQGKIAKKGIVNSKVVHQFMMSEFMQKSPPKSTGREWLNPQWMDNFIRQFSDDTSKEDMMATALECTVQSISTAIMTYGTQIQKVIITGGGNKNLTLISRLKILLPMIQIQTHLPISVDGQFKEALLMSLLGYFYTQEIAGNIPEVTGANKQVVLGQLHYVPIE